MDKKLTREQVLTSRDYEIATGLARYGKFLEQHGIPHLFAIDISPDAMTPRMVRMAFVPDDGDVFVDPLLKEVHQIVNIPADLASLSPSRLREAFEDKGGHPGFPLFEWQSKVASGETVDGYWEWVSQSYIQSVETSYRAKVSKLTKSLFGR